MLTSARVSIIIVYDEQDFRIGSPLRMLRVQAYS